MVNLLLSLGIVAGFLVLVYFLFFHRTGSDLEKFDEQDMDKFSEEALKTGVMDEFDHILQMDYATLNLNRYETQKNERNRAMLRTALKGCAQGNTAYKIYVKDYMKDVLCNKFEISSETINYVIPFNNVDQLSVQDKFEILLYMYEQKYKYEGFLNLLKLNGLDKPIGSGAEMHYEVTAEDINVTFKRHSKKYASLDYYDFLQIVTQRIYQISYGLGVIDEIRDNVLDGVQGGTSGIPNTFYTYGSDGRFGAAKGELPLTSYNAVWVMVRGNNVHLSCLGFLTQRELERVCKLIYKYDNPGTLDKETGRIVNFMQDGSRVTVARPDMCESWLFHVRKFDSASKMTLEELYPFDGKEKLITTLRWLVTGDRNIAITGEQAVGKSTLLCSMVQFLAASAGLRVQEMAFELHLRKLYPKRNIETYRETSTVSAQDGIEFIRKTDGSVGIFGEIAQSVIAGLAINMGQVGLRQIMFTHHAKTARDLIEWFRDAMIEFAHFSNEEIVERTVARVLNFDVHVAKDEYGTRYIERITELFPRTAEDYPADLAEAQKQYYYRQTDRRVSEDVDILVYDHGHYKFVNMISENSIAEISKCLSEQELVDFNKYLSAISQELQQTGGVA